MHQNTLADARIIIVDDMPSVTAVVQSWLELEGFHDITRRHNPERALAQLKDGLPADLVITDYTMLEMDGVTFANILSGIRPNLPILILTVHRVLIPDAAAKRYRIIDKVEMTSKLVPAVYEMLAEPLCAK
jgi:CheY-like chemotaxis protein